MAPKTVELAQRLLEALSAEEVQREAPEVMGPTMAEISGEGLVSVYPCCARLWIPAALVEALALKIGAPRGDYSIYQLQQLNQHERNETVEGLVLSDGRQPPRPRPPTLFEKSQVRSLLVLIDQVAATLASYRRLRDQKLLGGDLSSEPAEAEVGAPKSPATRDEPQLGGEAAPEEPQPRAKRRKRARAEKPAEVVASDTAHLAAGDDQTREAPPPPLPWTAPGHSRHPKMNGRLYITTLEGTEVCFKYAKDGEGACREPCPQGRAHVCQKCMGSHPMAECP